jgi:hypothetical protein
MGTNSNNNRVEPVSPLLQYLAEVQSMLAQSKASPLNSLTAIPPMVPVSVPALHQSEPESSKDKLLQVIQNALVLTEDFDMDDEDDFDSMDGDLE